MGTFIPISLDSSSEDIMRTVAVFLTFTLVINVCQAGLWAGIMDMVKRDATEEADVEVDHSLHDHHLEEQEKTGVDNSLDGLKELSKEGAVDNSLDDLKEQSKEGGVDNSLDDLTEQSKEGAGDNSLEDDNTLSEASKLAETDDTLSVESLDAVNTLSEASNTAEADNTLSEQSKLAKADITQSVDNTLSEESKLAKTDDTLSEESLQAVDTLSEESKLAEPDNTLSEEALEAVDTMSEDSLEVVNILPEAAKLVADDKSLSDLVEAEKSALDSSSDLDDVSDEARWFLHGTCSCDEHQSPGQQVATCHVDILRPEPEKYTYLGYNNCDQGYVPVCGRIFTVCYCLCKWDYNASTTTAAPATSAAPATTATPHGHDHE